LKVKCPECGEIFTTTAKTGTTCGKCGKKFKVASHEVKTPVLPITTNTLPITTSKLPIKNNFFSDSFKIVWPDFKKSVESIFKESKWPAKFREWMIIKKEVEERLK